MKIAMVAPAWIPVPPPKTGPVQKLIALLTDGLLERGHEVTLYAPGESSSRARLVMTRPDLPTDQYRAVANSVFPELAHAVTAYDQIKADDADIVHDHTMAGPIIGTARGIPLIHTLHRFLTDDAKNIFARLEPDVGLVAISHDQRHRSGDLRFLRTIPNGIDVAATPFSAEKEDYALFMGRINPYKGADKAIEAARRIGIKLVIIGRVLEPVEREYFEESIRPLFGEDVVYLGEASGTQCQELVAKARMVLFPVSWEEPFGLVMIEAAAAGTPVIAFDAGATSEVVQHNVSGFLVQTLDQMVEAAGRIDEIQPEQCRELARRNFNADRMIDDYLDAYDAFLESTP